VGQAFGAVGPDGGVAPLWRREPIRRGEPYRYYWRWEHTPRLELVSLDGRPAIWVGGEQLGAAAVLLRAGPESCWYVSGRLPRQELLNLAGSLPASPS